MGSTDGYVEVCLLPWSDKVEKTKTIKNSANPVWNQTFQFKVGKMSCCMTHLHFFSQIPGSEIVRQTLYMQLFDWDRMSKNDALGEVKLNLGYFDLSTAKTEWRQLQKYSGKVCGRL